MPVFGNLLKKTIYSKAYDVLRRLIREERQRLGISQAEFGKRLGTHQPFVARVEMGERRLDVIEFIQVARALGVKPEAFLKRLEREIE